MHHGGKAQGAGISGDGQGHVVAPVRDRKVDAGPQLALSFLVYPGPQSENGTTHI